MADVDIKVEPQQHPSAPVVEKRWLLLVESMPDPVLESGCFIQYLRSRILCGVPIRDTSRHIAHAQQPVTPLRAFPVHSCPC